MGIELRMPNINGNEKEQLVQIRSYLYQLIPQLQWALNNVNATELSSGAVNQIAKQIGSMAVSGSGGTTVGAEVSFDRIKELIIKSSDIVEAYYEEINKKLSGLYVAESDFGTFVQKTEQDIIATSTYTDQLFSDVQTIISDEINGVKVSVGKDMDNLNTSFNSTLDSRISKEVAILNSAIEITNDEIDGVKSHVDSTNLLIGKANERIGETNVRIGKVEDAIVTTNTRIDGVNTSIDETNGKITEVEGAIEDTNNRIAVVTKTIAETNKAIETVNNNITTANGKIDDLTTVINETNDSIKALEDATDVDLTELNSELSKINGTIGEINTTVESIGSEVKTIDGRVTKVDGQIVGINSSVQAIEGDITNINTHVEEVDGQIVGINNSVSNVEELAAGINESVVNVESAIKDTNVKVDETSGDVANLKAAVEDTSDKVANLNADIEAAKEGIKDLNIMVYETYANTRSGLLDDKVVPPVYGFEVGQRNLVNGVEVFNKYARFTADRLSFYDQNDTETTYISDDKLYIRNAEIKVSSQEGGYKDFIDANGGIVTKWVGGDN